MLILSSVSWPVSQEQVFAASSSYAIPDSLRSLSWDVSCRLLSILSTFFFLNICHWTHHVHLAINLAPNTINWWTYPTKAENIIKKTPNHELAQTCLCPLILEVYLVLETWSSEGRNGLLTVADEVFPKAVRPNSLIWERPSVLASRGRWRRRQTAEATSAFTSWIFI